MRSRFDEQLALLNKEMIEMGALCEEVIALASKALTEADPELAQRSRRRGKLEIGTSSLASRSSPCRFFIAQRISPSVMLPTYSPLRFSTGMVA